MAVEIPTKTDESIGRVVSDRRPVLSTDLPYVVPGATYERFKDAVLANATAIGEANGVTAGSIEEALRSLDAPSSSRDRWVFKDNLFRLSSEWTNATTGAGTGASLAADDSDADSGAGHYKIEATASGNSEFYNDVHFVAGRHSPTFRARVKLIGTVADFIASCGLYDVSGFGSYVTLSTSGGVWTVIARSEATATNDSDASAVTPTLGWHDIRIEVEAGVSAAYYVDDVLIGGAGLDPDSVPRGTDVMTPDFLVNHGANSGGGMVIDWVEVEGSN